MRHECCRTSALNGFGHYQNQVEKFRNKIKKLRSGSVTPRLKCTAPPGKPGNNSEKLDLKSCQGQYLNSICPVEQSAFVTSHYLPTHGVSQSCSQQCEQPVNRAGAYKILWASRVPPAPAREIQYSRTPKQRAST